MPANRSTYAGSNDEKQRSDDSTEAPVEVWHEQIGDPTLADGILDRLVHNAHRIEMRGDSMRKVRTKPSG
jgi:DNA replication protein DnaC